MTAIDLNLFRSKPKLFLQDSLLILIMVILAACGLIYQYLLSHYAGRVLGVMEHAIYTMIGIMIVSMGIGAFVARYFRCAHTSFAWLEAIIALLGSTGILLIGGSFALSALFPEILAKNFSLPSDTIPHGTLSDILYDSAKIMPFVIGFFIGMMIGMEIPFIARIREKLYGQHLEHNVGTIYGADYIGAGIGAAIFIVYMLSIPPQEAALYTAAANLITGFIFLIWYFKTIKCATLLFFFNLWLGIVILALGTFGSDWHKTLEDTLYEDQVIFSTDTQHQHITLTKRRVSVHTLPVYTLFLNGRTQFSSDDEYIYHDMLVHPSILASARHENILIIGGGDGLALRTALKWEPKQVTLLELDAQVVKLFSEPYEENGISLNQPLLELNKNAFNDSRVNVIFGDAFNTIDRFVENSEKFDVIIVDLPDPSHPNLNKLYSARFYNKIYYILAGDGAVSIQSTSPYHAKRAFLTVGVTLREAGFEHVERYHKNVPSFGQWGWTIATKFGGIPRRRIQETKKNLPENSWATKELILASFIFSRDYFVLEDQLEPNRLGTHLMYLLHQEAWMEEQGLTSFDR